MIYVCEYDGSLDAQTLQGISEQFPLAFSEGWQSGHKWKKARQRILAWLLFAYGMEQIGVDVNWQTSGKKFAIEENRQASGKKHAIDKKKQNKEVSRGIGGIFQRLEIIRDAHGKPFSVRHPELFFNLSHCDNACACIIDNVPAGIDVEQKFPYKENLERNFCHPKEREILKTLVMVEREKQQQILWSLKESLVKLNGRGIGYGLKNIDLSEFLPIIHGKHRMHIQMEPEQHTSCVQMEPDQYAVRVQIQENYTLVACATCSGDEGGNVNCKSENADGGENAAYTDSHLCINSMNVEKVTENELSMWIKRQYA